MPLQWKANRDKPLQPRPHAWPPGAIPPGETLAPLLQRESDAARRDHCKCKQQLIKSEKPADSSFVQILNV